MLDFYRSNWQQANGTLGFNYTSSLGDKRQANVELTASWHVELWNINTRLDTLSDNETVQEFLFSPPKVDRNL